MAGTPWFGNCPYCGDEGELLAVVVKSSGELRLICDECEQGYACPTVIGSGDGLPALPPVRLATEAEWTAAGWEPVGYLGFPVIPATFSNACRGLHLDGTDFAYFSEGAYSLVFVNTARTLVLKVYRADKVDRELARKTFESEVRALEIAAASDELRDLVPRLHETRQISAVLDHAGSNVSDEVYADLALLLDFVPGKFLKLATLDSAIQSEIKAKFRFHGIGYLDDASISNIANGKLKVIDFATHEIEVSWK